MSHKTSVEMISLFIWIFFYIYFPFFPLFEFKILGGVLVNALKATEEQQRKDLFYATNVWMNHRHHHRKEERKFETYFYTPKMRAEPNMKLYLIKSQNSAVL